jgi:hypothetical protein
MGGWTDEQDLQFSMQQALQSSDLTVKDMQRKLDEEKWRVIAKQVIEHLRFRNWKIERGPSRPSNHGKFTVDPVNTPSTFKEFDNKTGK